MHWLVWFCVDWVRMCFEQCNFMVAIVQRSLVHKPRFVEWSVELVPAVLVTDAGSGGLGYVFVGGKWLSGGRAQ